MNTFNDNEYDRVCDENEKLKAEVERLRDQRSTMQCKRQDYRPKSSGLRRNGTRPTSDGRGSCD